MSNRNEIAAISINSEGEVVLVFTEEYEIALPPNTAVKLACLMLTVAGCQVAIEGYQIWADASRVSARDINTDARRKFDA